MQTRPIDPRDQTWENDAPSYRVLFWTRCGPWPDAMWAAEEWELTEADVQEAVRWVSDNAKGRRSSLWAVVKTGNDVGLIRLAGSDPTASAETFPSWATQDAGS